MRGSFLPEWYDRILDGSVCLDCNECNMKRCLEGSDIVFKNFGMFGLCDVFVNG